MQCFKGGFPDQPWPQSVGRKKKGRVEGRGEEKDEEQGARSGSQVQRWC